MKVFIQTTCSYKSHAYNSEIDVQTKADNEGTVITIDNKKYPTDKMLRYCMKQADITAKYHLDEARKEMFYLRFVRKNKLNLFSLIIFVFDDDEEWLTTYFYDHKSKKTIQIFMSHNDFMSSDLSEIYGNISDAVTQYGVTVN
jgi:hypothetical protein